MYHIGGYEATQMMSDETADGAELDATTILSEREEREAAYRHVFMGETMADVGDVLGVSSSTVSNIVSEYKSGGAALELAILEQFTDEHDPEPSEGAEFLTAVVDMDEDSEEGDDEPEVATDGGRDAGGEVACPHCSYDEGAPAPGLNVCSECGGLFTVTSGGKVQRARRGRIGDGGRVMTDGGVERAHACGLAPVVERALSPEDAREALGAVSSGAGPRVSRPRTGWAAARHASDRLDG